MQVADGFGISLAEMQLICAQLAAEVDLSSTEVDKQVENLFKILDNDNNALVDAIEFLAGLAAASGLTLRNKIEFVLNCFDFDGTGQLTIDEMTLAFRCTLSGLCKMCGEHCPLEEELEIIALRAFKVTSSNHSSNSDRDQNCGTDAFIGPLARLHLLVEPPESPGDLFI